MKQRIQFDMEPLAVDRLEDVKERTDVRSRVDVIRNALTLYCWLSDQYEAGYTIKFLKTKGFGEVEVELPGLGLEPLGGGSHGQRLEDAADIKLAEEVLVDPERTPWDEVQMELGLDQYLG